MSYLIKKQIAESKAKKFFYGVLGLALLLGLVIYLITPPSLDDHFCPADKAKMKLVKLSMLIDITDDLSNQNKKIMNHLISDWIDSGISGQKLAIYSLNTSNINDFEDIDTICSPPSASLLAFSFGRQKANQRIDEFKNRVYTNIAKSSVGKTKLNNSRILEAVRQMTNGPSWFAGSSRLILISDLIEKSDYADFYSGSVPDFTSWLQRSNNLALVDSIQMTKGDRVQICQLLTDKPGYAARDAAKNFWIELFRYKGISEVYFACNGIVRD